MLAFFFEGMGRIPMNTVGNQLRRRLRRESARGTNACKQAPTRAVTKFPHPFTLVAIVALPFALRPKRRVRERTTPSSSSRRTTRRSVTSIRGSANGTTQPAARGDQRRIVGGTSESRVSQCEITTAFENYWTPDLGRRELRDPVGFSETRGSGGRPEG